jgi:hypothetical protein
MMFQQVAYLVVFILSNGVDQASENAGKAICDDSGDAWSSKDEAEEEQLQPAEVALAARKAAAQSAVFALLPLASCFFWHLWAETLALRGSDDWKGDDVDSKNLRAWLDKQFKIPTQQKFRIGLEDLVYRNNAPMGGSVFQQRGTEVSSEGLPWALIVQTKLEDKEVNKIALALKETIPNIGLSPTNLAKEIAQVHMFCYTFDNRLQTSSKPMPFSPYIIWKSDVPSRISEILDDMLKWGRPVRPLIIQSHSGHYYVRTLECTCEPMTMLHKQSSTSCVLRRRLWKCTSALAAIDCWLKLMKTQFKNQLIDGTVIDRLTREWQS